MTRHAELDDAARDQAALAAMDALSAAEARAFQEHVGECEPCRGEYRAIRSVMSDLALIAPEVAPPEGLWPRLVAKLRGPTPPQDQPPHNGTVVPAEAAAAEQRLTQTWKGWAPDASPAGQLFAYVAADAGAWEPTAVDGIEARRLFVDTAGDRVTMLVRMAAGAGYPSHVHASAEECFVLSGDLRTGTAHLREGDYQRAEAGSIHPVQVTDGGCVLLLVSSLHDRLLPV